jgi:hypothetical protein
MFQLLLSPSHNFPVRLNPPGTAECLSLAAFGFVALLWSSAVFRVARARGGRG